MSGKSVWLGGLVLTTTADDGREYLLRPAAASAWQNM